MALRVSSAVIEGLRFQAEYAHPRECCGILFGAAEEVSSFVPAANVHPDPQSHFEIDPAALIEAHRQARAGGPQIVGYYHSHPAGPAEPSATDRAMSAHDGMLWAIIAGADVTFWRDDETCFVALPYAVREG